MLKDSIKNSIKQMKQMESMETAAIDAEKKNKNDMEFSALVNDFVLTIERVHSTNKELGFQPSDETIASLNESIELLDGIVTYGVVDERECQTAKQHITKKVKPALTKEWNTFYQGKTKGIGNKLSTISNLVHDKERISRIREGIVNASNWSSIIEKDASEQTTCSKFKQAIYDVDHLEDELNLNDSIKAFVTKVMKGTARLTDVDEDILDWINSENLQDMFVVCFDE